METDSKLRAQVRTMLRQEFVRAYRHPFLGLTIAGLAGDDDDASDYITRVPMNDALTPPAGIPAAMSLQALAAIAKKPDANQFSFVTIGRANNNDIVIPVDGVSKLHAVINQSSAGYTVADAGSRNGTTLNGRALNKNVPSRITPGDTLTLSSRVTAIVLDAASAYIWYRNFGT